MLISGKSSPLLKVERYFICLLRLMLLGKCSPTIPISQRIIRDAKNWKVVKALVGGLLSFWASSINKEVLMLQVACRHCQWEPARFRSLWFLWTITEIRWPMSGRSQCREYKYATSGSSGYSITPTMQRTRNCVSPIRNLPRITIKRRKPWTLKQDQRILPKSFFLNKR